MAIKILVTRPEPGLSQVMERLIALKKAPVALPMLQIKTLSPLEKIAGNTILVTSLHALPALKRQERSCRILSVGKVTSYKAKKLGFKHVFSAEGNAQKLKELYLEMGCKSQDSWLAAGCGDNGELYGDFLVESLNIRRFKTYQVKWTSSLSEKGRDFLREDARKQILFYSSETVRSFLNLIEREEFENNFSINREKIEIFCFSPAISGAVKKDPRHIEWARIEDNVEAVFQ